jgi:hypothetical protein
MCVFDRRFCRTFVKKTARNAKKKSRPEGRDSCLSACQFDQNVEVMSWLDR